MISFNTWPHASSRFCSLLSFVANIGRASKMATTRTPAFLVARLPGIYFILSSQGADHNGLTKGQPCPKSKRGVQVRFRGSSSREWRRPTSHLTDSRLRVFRMNPPAPTIGHFRLTNLWLGWALKIPAEKPIESTCLDRKYSVLCRSSLESSPRSHARPHRSALGRNSSATLI